MSLNRKQKAYGAVLATLFSGLGVDKLFLAPEKPATAMAAAVPAAQPAADAAAPAASTSTDPSFTQNTAGADHGPVLADRLQSLSEEQGLRISEIGNAFRPSPVWVSRPKPAVKTKDQAPSKAAQFLRAHRLSAVLSAGETGVAIINGKAIKIGSELDGFRLVEVGRRSATLEAGGQSAQLAIQSDLHK